MEGHYHLGTDIKTNLLSFLFLIVYGLMVISVFYALDIYLRFTILFHFHISQIMFDAVCYLMDFIRFFFELFLLTGAVNYARTVITAGTSEPVALFRVYKRKKAVTSSLIFAFFLSAFLTAVIVLLDISGYYQQSILFEAGSLLTVNLLKIGSVLVALAAVYIQYRLLYLPFLIAMDVPLRECYRNSVRLTHHNKVIGKRWLLLSALPMALYAGITRFLSSSVLFHTIDWPIYLELSLKQLGQWVAGATVIVLFFPLQLFGYQLLLLDLQVTGYDPEET